MRSVVLVPFAEKIELECESGLRELERHGYEVRRVRCSSALDRLRSQMASDALQAGFVEFIWIDPEIGFRLADVEQLRSHTHPFVGAMIPLRGQRGLDCSFLPGTERIFFGPKGGLIELRHLGFGLTMTRQMIFEKVLKQFQFPICTDQSGRKFRPWFLPLLQDEGQGANYLSDQEAFCLRARQCGIRILADTTLCVSRMGNHGYSWEEVGIEKERSSELGFRLPPSEFSSPKPVPVPPVIVTPTSKPATESPLVNRPVRNGLHAAPLPLRDDFPRFSGAYIVSYPANRVSLEKTLESFRCSDWGSDPEVLMQPEDWPLTQESAARNYHRALEKALQDGGDFALILEDDVRVNRHLRANLSQIPLVKRDQCDYLSLYIPDLILSPWEREERHLGYRLARPLYSGSNQKWARNRIWGAQAYLLSKRLLRVLCEQWGRLKAYQDSRVISICSELRLPLWYTFPCLADHAPVKSGFGTPTAHAPDFDADFQLQLGEGFQPPEEIPGWLTLAEGKLLWQSATGKRVLEMGTSLGRSTVCLGQSAAHLTSVDQVDQSEAREWCHRFGTDSRTTLIQGEVQKLLEQSSDRFDLIFVDTEHDAKSLTRDIEIALQLLKPGGQLAFHDYPDPGWPEVRQVVDAYASRLKWRRIEQADYVGVFQTG